MKSWLQDRDTELHSTHNKDLLLKDLLQSSRTKFTII